MPCQRYWDVPCACRRATLKERYGHLPVRCPVPVIQGKNDPRVKERRSRDVVEQLQAAGKQVDYLVFEDEGHDVLTYENRVTCYTAITEFFKMSL
jgi:dipeptidyl aminopeptidase/acylaminoacyl peptidase